MNLSEPFIKRPIMTSLVVLAILFTGIVSYQGLPVSDLPAVAYPTLVVTANLPGASPLTMANSITTPLERAFMAIEGVETITSTSSQGTCQIILQFHLDTDISAAAQDVGASINSTQPLLPPNMPTNPSYQKVNPAQAPIMYLVLSSDTAPLSKLYDYANTFIGERISVVPGVAAVTTYGSPYAARIQVDPQLIATRSQDLAFVSNAISQNNANLPMGNFDGPHRYFLMDADGQINDAKGYQSLIINYQNNAPLTMSGVGLAVDSEKNNKAYTHFISKTRDEACAILSIQKQAGANTVDINTAIRKLLPSLERSLPASVHLTISRDQSIPIIESVNDVKFTLTLAFILVVLVIFLYLGKITDTVIPLLVLPMSIIGTFFIMSLLGYSIDTLSLLALTLAIGFIIDDAIVVLENIVRHIEEGQTPFQAAMNGSKQISITVLTMTICLCSVFIPMLFMEGMLGRIFREFAVTIVLTILFSGAISLTLTPMLCSRFIPARVRGGGKDAGFSERFHVALLRSYGNALNKVLKHPEITLCCGIILLIITGVLFSILPTTLNDNQDIGMISGSTETAQNSSSLNTMRHQLLVNEIIKNDPNVEDFTSIAGQSNNKGLLAIRLKPLKDRLPMEQVLEGLYPKLSAIAGIKTFLQSIPLINLSQGTGSNASYQYVVSSFHPEDLYRYTAIMTQKMAQLPGFQNVSNDMQITTPRMYLTIDRDKLAMYGLTATSVENLLGLAYGGGKISTIMTASNEYDVIVEVSPEFQKNPTALKYLWLKSPQSNKTIPLMDLIKTSMTTGPSTINHYNQFPSVTISFDLASGVALSQASEAIDHLASQVLPIGISGRLIGEALAFQATMNNLIWLMALAILFIYMLLGILYESYILPFTVLSALPVAIFGALVTLLLFGEILSLFALVGLMLLIGIVQKNGIMLVDYANEYMKEPGKTAQEAIFQACLVRFRPIVMTSIAAIMGALPIALGIGGNGARQPLGLVIVGGLIFSQMVTLFLTPVVFVHFEHLQEFLLKKLGIQRQHELEQLEKQSP